ncbi:MAG: tRNA pseudouridine(38-40) synthase TruA [Desulfovibrio sp.]|uniref:tRNA pseudouridine(38-40) synthase TruA n=1 Tax=Desulfovibrio sp. 7SRBS1 TaxID=3378064 RepID=UPI003B3E2B5F
MSTTRIRMTLAYVGTHLYGWQSQPDGNTVQDLLEGVLGKICGSFIRVQGSGRTDSGVHARGQVAHADIPTNRLSIDWIGALNSMLPDTISVLDVRPVPDDFHARFSVIAKTYSYTLWLDRRIVLPERRPFVWMCGPFDAQALQAMDEAAAILVGEHDFAAFQNTGTPVSSTVRTIHSFARQPACSCRDPREVVWHVRADGFLKQMVRNLMGCIVAVGQGKVSVADVRSLLIGGDRTKAPRTAPAEGLCLERVEYPETAQSPATPLSAEKIELDHAQDWRDDSSNFNSDSGLKQDR